MDDWCSIDEFISRNDAGQLLQLMEEFTDCFYLDACQKKSVDD